MTSAAVREAIRDRVASVPNIGIVHDYERYAERLSDLKPLYQYKGAHDAEIRGWFIRRVSARRQWIDTYDRRVLTNWRIRGYMSFVDATASEKAFDGLIDAMAEAFRADPTLGGAVDSINITDGASAGLQLESAEPVVFGGILCHSATLGLTTQEIETDAGEPAGEKS